ncbi:MAG: endonuclease VIII [Elainellaceae cyanobacterium]
MPEGPEIKRAADRIAKAIAHRPTTELFFAFDHLKPYEQKLQGQTVLSVRSRGKAMLIRFENDLSIYSHNQLYGKWMIRNAYSFPDTNRQLRLAIHTEKKSALLYSASDIEVLNDTDIAQHSFLKNLGLDVLDDSTTVEAVISQLTDPQFRRRRLTTLLLDQHFLCGLGNYLRSEVLFVARVHPSLRPIDCDADQIHQVAQAAIALPRQSYETGGITNDLERVEQLKEQGYSRSAYRHWVYKRDGKSCYQCGTEIVRESSGGRAYYYCPTCQQR